MCVQVSLELPNPSWKAETMQPSQRALCITHKITFTPFACEVDKWMLYERGSRRLLHYLPRSSQAGTLLPDVFLYSTLLTYIQVLCSTTSWLGSSWKCSEVYKDLLLLALYLCLFIEATDCSWCVFVGPMVSFYSFSSAWHFFVLHGDYPGRLGTG